MTNLEWINEQIEECDKMIEHLNIRKDEYSKNKSLVKTYNQHIKNLTGVKQHFEQIKTELEAWGIIKNHMELHQNQQYSLVKETTTKTSETIQIRVFVNDQNQVQTIINALEME